MEIVLKDNRERPSRPSVRKNKGIILRNADCGGICIRHQYVLSVETPCLMGQTEEAVEFAGEAPGVWSQMDLACAMDCVALGRLLNLSASTSSSTKWEDL